MNDGATYERSLDDKQRLAIPRPLKDGESEELYLAPGKGGCLVLYSIQGFESLAQRMTRLSTGRVNMRNYLRLFYGQAERIRVDRQSRIRIPERLIRLAGLQHDVVLIRVEDHIEIWDKGRWNSRPFESKLVAALGLVVEGRKSGSGKAGFNAGRGRTGLAMAVGISYTTLKKYIKMGCPTSSVEDIKQWIKNRRAGQITDLARAVGISNYMLRKCFKMGCPRSSVDDIKKWIDDHKEAKHVPISLKRRRKPNITDLAGAVGISDTTLHRYFRAGCPKSSVDDIKKWIDDHKEAKRVPISRERRTLRKPNSITDLAGAVGISDSTLHRYIKRGCPKSSVEDIKKWIDDHREAKRASIFSQKRKTLRELGLRPSIADLAEEVGISDSTLHKYFKMGCPKSSAEDIRQWIKNHRAGRVVELARAVGISYFTLQKYIRIGCPKSSAEDIRQWINNYRSIHRRGKSPEIL